MKTNVTIKCMLLLLLAGLFQSIEAQLPVPEYQPGIAILTGEIKNFSPQQNLDIRCSVPNLIMIKNEPIFIEPDSTGHFRQNIVLKHPTQVRVKIGKDNLYLLMSPDNREYHLSIEANEKGEIKDQFIYTNKKEVEKKLSELVNR